MRIPSLYIVVICGRIGLFRGSHLVVILLAVLISASVLTMTVKSVYANSSGNDTWGLSPIQNYVDTSFAINNCDPYGGDHDGDGICDNWEDGTYGPGLHIHFTQNGINYSYDINCDPNLAGDCPSPTHKDVYVELDWMQGHAPGSNVISDVVNAFNIAPVQNLDNTNGVHLHVQYGEDPTSSSGDTGVHVTALKVKTALWNTNDSPNYGYWVLKENRFGTIAERNTSTSSPNTFCVHSDGTPETWHDCGTAKRQVFHYAVFIHQQSEVPASSGWAEIFGNDFVISLGSFAGGVGSLDDQESAFMHELGHNLGLYHGGGVPPDVNNNGAFDQTDDDSDNCKPNYLSIMSYTYEFRSTNDVCRPLDYSRVALNPLNEVYPNLHNSNVGSYPYPAQDPDPPGAAPGTCDNTAHNGKERPIWYSNGVGAKAQATTGMTVTWNSGMRPPLQTNYGQNINGLGVTGCSTTYRSLLTGHDDWNNLNYSFTSSALSTSGNVTGAAKSNKCDGLSYLPVGYLRPPQLAPSGNSSSLNAQLTNVGGVTILKSGLIPAGGTASNIDKIIIPGVVNSTDTMNSIAQNTGATYLPANSTQMIGGGMANDIPVYTLSKSEGNLAEWACSSHQEITLDQTTQLREDKIDSIKFAVDAMPSTSFKNPASDASTLDGFLETAKESNSLYDLNGVIGALQSVNSSASNLIIDPQAQSIVIPRIDDALTSFMVANAVTPYVQQNKVAPNTILSLTPSDPSGSSVSFSFRSDVSSSTFECQLDGNAFSACTSPQSYSNLPDGQHQFQVRAVANGLTDTAPQTFTWTVNTGGGNGSLWDVIIGYGLAILFGVVIAVAFALVRKK